MGTESKLVLYHAPQTRSAGVLALLEELAAPYELQVLNMQKGEHRRADYLAINPMGKVPALRHGEAVITEQVAIDLYLADLFPEVGLAPSPTDPLRGPYLRWMVYYAACFEPAIVDHHLKRESGPRGLSPFADYDTMLSAISRQLAQNTYLLGEHFSAADVLWATSLDWTTAWGLVPNSPEIAAYIERVVTRPALVRARARDAQLVAAMQG